MRRVALAAFALAVACQGPRDPSPGRASAPASAAPTATAPSAARPARIHPMKAGEQLGGPNATGKVGDWVLENDEVVFVIDALGGGGGFAESGGNLVDAADARVRKDELGQVFTYFGQFPRQAVYTRLEPSTAPDGSVVLTASGKEIHEPSIEVVTRYRLHPRGRAMTLETTLENRGAAPAKLGLGDAIQWGGCEKIAPGKPVGFKGRSSGAFLGGVGRFTSYGIAAAEGPIDAISGGVWSDTEQVKDVTIAPGASVRYERSFSVGERGDSASVVVELARRSPGVRLGRVEVSLVDGRGRTITAPAGAKLLVSTQAGEDALTVVAAQEGATFGAEIPVGRWRVRYGASAGRRGDGANVVIDVQPGAVARAKLVVSDVATLSVSCADALPCRVTVDGQEGTEAPDFGPPHVATAAKNQVFFSGSGAGAQVAVPPGRYRLTFTRGPEYSAEIVELDAKAGATAEAHATLRRVVDTSGYLATDFHQHSILSADAPVAVPDRVRSNAVEGVEVAVASEHNNVVDMTPVVASLGLSSVFVSIAGDEITTDADKNAWGHANVFPLTPRADLPRAGAFAFLGRTPREVFDEARRRPERPVVQINHPRSGANGYFDRTGFDPDAGVGTAPGYDATFDSVEVWNGRNVQHRTRVLEDFMALLRTGHPVTPIADTDTHGIVGQEAGYPRTYVRVERDDALEQWSNARTADLLKGVRERRDVVLTNGPFLRVSANGAPIGGVARGSVVTVKVRVLAAPFVKVDRVEVRRATSRDVVSGAPDAQGAVELRVRADRDDAIVVVASGTAPMRTLLRGDDAELEPWAMSGAIWIDADGDGKALGREVVR